MRPSTRRFAGMSSTIATTSSTGSTASRRRRLPETYRKFEAMVLQNFIKTMLPESEEVYGKGASGEIWKGMMAEKIARKSPRTAASALLKA